MKIFQYGSNCSTNEINSADRLHGDATFVDIAQTVGEFELAFDVYSISRGCAAADITASPGNKVWGVLWEVPDFLMGQDTASAQSRRSFDQIEGKKYKRETIIVLRLNGETVEAVTYRAKEPQPGLKTSLGYVALIINGLREHGVADNYIARVKALASANNPGIAAEVQAL